MLYNVVFSTADYILMFFVRKLSDFLIFIFLFCKKREKGRFREREKIPPLS
jgi:hypothetical protein